MSRVRWRRPPSSWSRKRKVTLVLVCACIFAIQLFIFVERNLKPPLMSLAKVRIKQMATQSINAAIADRISEKTNVEHLIDWKLDHQGKITGFMLNYAEHMRITSETINSVQKILNDLRVMNEHIPIGQALGSAVLASFGPEIPVRLVPVGSVKVDLNTRHENAGINMILIEVYVRVIAEVTVIIPFDTDTEIVETDIPISYSLVVGDVPTYYFDNKGNPVGPNKEQLPPHISIPPMKSIPPADKPTQTQEKTVQDE
jgi:sporulation protein YunB